MIVRLKAKVRSVTHHEPLQIPGYTEGIDVLMVPVTDKKNEIPEDQRFHVHANPSGEIRFHVTNPAVAEWLKPGRRFRITIEEDED